MTLSAHHLSFAQLIDLAESGSAENVADGAGTADAHLAACSQCRMELDGVRRMMASLYRDELQAPPAALTEQVLRMFRPAARAEPAEQPLATALRALVALLRFDSGLTPAFGMRSAQGLHRQLFYSVDEYDIDVRLAAEADGWRVEGQVLGSANGGTAELAGAAQRYSGEINDLGEFVFGGVAPGSYQLLFALPEVEIAVPELALPGDVP
jgi:hypothetical protein